MVNGHAVDINPIQAMLNPAAPMEAIHMTLAALETTAFATAAVYAFALLRKRRTEYARRGLVLCMAIATITAPLQIWVGDVTSKMVAQTQPAKLAAMEGLFKTTRYAPLTLFGWPDPATQRTYFGIQISDLLSVLAYYDMAHPVRGLSTFPSALQPDPRILHECYDSMAGIGFALVGLVVWFWFIYYRQWRNGTTGQWGKWLLRSVVASGPLTFAAIELGWAVTELGRQPYIVYGYMLVKDGVTTANGPTVIFPTFFILYIILAIATIVFLRRLGHDKREDPAPISEIRALSLIHI